MCQHNSIANKNNHADSFLPVLSESLAGSAGRASFQTGKITEQNFSHHSRNLATKEKNQLSEFMSPQGPKCLLGLLPVDNLRQSISEVANK